MRLHIPLTALLLVTLVAPQAAAAECPDVAVWAIDDEKDVYDLPQNINSGMDILELRVGEAGADCDRIVLGVTINDPLVADPAVGSGAQDADHPSNVGSQRVVLALESVEGEPSVAVHYVWAQRVNTSEEDHISWWVELYINGELISETMDGNNDKLADEAVGGHMNASIARSVLAGVTAWTGAAANATEWAHDAYAERGGPGYSPDVLVANQTYTVGYGIGTPPVPEAPATEPEPTVSEPEPTGDDPAAGGGGAKGEPAGHDHCLDGCHAEPLDAAQGKQSPGVGIVLVLALLGAVAVLRARRD